MAFFLPSLRSALSISSMSSLIFLASSSAWSRFSRSVADSFGGGRRVMLMGSESERFLFVEIIWERNVETDWRDMVDRQRVW